MYPFFSQDLARQHRKELLYEAERDHQLARSYDQQPVEKIPPASFTSDGIWSTRWVGLVVLADELELPEVGRGVQWTLAALSEMDASSQEVCIQAFLQKLRDQRVLSQNVLPIFILIPNYRLILCVALLGVLLPLFVGIALGTSQGVLMGESLFCLAGLLFILSKTWAFLAPGKRNYYGPRER